MRTGSKIIEILTSMKEIEELGACENVNAHTLCQ